MRWSSNIHNHVQYPRPGTCRHEGKGLESTWTDLWKWIINTVSDSPDPKLQRHHFKVLPRTWKFHFCSNKMTLICLPIMHLPELIGTLAIYAGDGNKNVVKKDLLAKQWLCTLALYILVLLQLPLLRYLTMKVNLTNSSPEKFGHIR